MFDWTKANIINAIQDWQKFNSIDFVSPMVRNTGEVFDKKTFVQDSMKITYRDKPINELKRIELSGSLHQHLQDGFNYQDFGYTGLFRSIRSVCDTYSLNPHLVTLENLEIGVNVSPLFNPTTLLHNAFSYGTNTFTDMTNKFHKKIGVKCPGGCLIKAYNKRYQLNLDSECVRYELHFDRMRTPQQRAGIYTFADLLDPIKYQRLANYLLDQFDRLVFLNQMADCRNLKPADKRLIKQWRNPLFVTELMRTNPQMFRKNRKRYLELVNEDKSNEYNELKRLIRLKVNKMLQFDVKTLKQVKFYLNNFNRFEVTNH